MTTRYYALSAGGGHRGSPTGLFRVVSDARGMTLAELIGGAWKDDPGLIAYLAGYEPGAFEIDGDTAALLAGTLAPDQKRPG